MVEFDDGTGGALYVAGSFGQAGAATVNLIAKWNGSYWSPVGGGLGGGGVPYSLVVFDDGTGPALYAGGGFTSAGGALARYVARWNGIAWSAVGSVEFDSAVRALASFNGSLYAAGQFNWYGSAPMAHIARWNGSDWVPLSSGLDGLVLALATVDVGSGPALFAGGQFTFSGGQFLNHVAKWDGTAWSSLGGGASGEPWTLGGWNDSLFVGGRIGSVGCGTLVHGIASWGCLPECYANCDGSACPPVLNVLDFSCFINTFAAGGSYANCDGSTIAPVINVLDFACFINRFAAGCP